jgi:hypothetical protein
MEDACNKGEPNCHRTDAHEVKVESPRNPIPSARMFHAMFATTKGFCANTGPTAVGPNDLMVDYALGKYIQIAPWVDGTFPGVWVMML